jgi:hypothetical protein
MDLVPQVEEGEKICGLFAEWLGGQPGQFREPIPFLTRGDMELEWDAAAGGVAMAGLYSGREALSMSLLLSGIDAEADQGILNGFLQMMPPGAFQPAAERPLLITLLVPEIPEAIPTIQLLTTALASVFFRTVLRLHKVS